MKSLPPIFSFICLFISLKVAFATSWRAALPYVQRTDGQQVVVKAFSYDPYAAMTTAGVTKVYHRKKLLYSVDKYYRERICTSEDGQYLVVIQEPSYSSVLIPTPNGFKADIDFQQPAFEVFKNGELFRTYTLQDVVDTIEFANGSPSAHWVTYMDHSTKEAFDDAVWNCSYWKKDLTRKEKQACLDGDTTFYCREWIQGCDSSDLYARAIAINKHAVYVEDNVLHAITHQNMVIKLDFRDMNLQRIPVEQIIPDRETFSPPETHRTYKKAQIPDQFAAPRVQHGESIESAVSDLLELPLTESSDTRIFTVFCQRLVVDKNGTCIDFWGKVYDNRISEYSTKESVNQEMTEKLTAWIEEQRFETKLIPKGFDWYTFRFIVQLQAS